MLIGQKTANGATSSNGVDDSTISISDDRTMEEEHESNGPEGARGVPMQRMPAKGIVFVFVTLAGSGALAWRAVKEAKVKPQ